MYEHASAILVKSSSSSQLSHEKDLVDSTAHKSGEMEQDMKPKGKKKYSGMKEDVLYCFIWLRKGTNIICIWY